jgi:hypothetical protein
MIGKTNLDQFATGLVGVRSPYGIPNNPIRADLIPGRLEFGIGGRGIGRPGAAGARHRYRGIRPRAGDAQQHRRTEAEPRADLDRGPGAGLPDAGLHFDLFADGRNLGRYTNFANLFDLCGIAVPAGFQANGLPAGITLIAPAFREAMVAGIAARLHRSVGLPAGATGLALPPARPIAYGTDGLTQILVIGAHLGGMALNRELTDAGAALVETCRTAPTYRLYALPGAPARPGMIRVAEGGGAIEGELWHMTDDAFGRFVRAIPAPLSIGSVALADGRTVKGFLCEVAAIEEALDITSYGGWRAWQASGTR